MLHLSQLLFLAAILIPRNGYGSIRAQDRSSSNRVNVDHSSTPTATPTPVVMWHGMGDSCCNPLSLGSVQRMLERMLPGVHVHSLRIGNSFTQDTENGFFMNVNKQVDMACKLIEEDEKLKDGYNALGFSQGSQFLRAVAQRCPQGMKRLITFGGQHQGIYGLPQCLGERHRLCDYARRLLNYGAYTSWLQRFLVQAEYWHDPLDEQTYREKSVFLAEINNDRVAPELRNQTYKDNLQKLEKFVMLRFNNDTVVDPKGTEWFSFYAPGQSEEMVPLRQSRLYKEDWLGLKAMDEQGKLVFLAKDGNHLQLEEKFFQDEIVDKFLSVV